MKIKKILFTSLAIAVILVVSLYFTVPIIARNIIHRQISDNPDNSVESIEISWQGPQIISALKISDTFGSAQIDVAISNNLFSLALGQTPIDIHVSGNATIKKRHDTPKKTTGKKSKSTKPPESPTTIPSLKVHAELDTLTFEDEESIQFHDVSATVDIDPGMHFAAAIHAVSELDGSIDIDCNAPNILRENGEFNWNASATCNINIENTVIPTINGVGGWSILKMSGNLSSPNIEEHINVSVNGSFAEYDRPRGSAIVKAQLIKSNSSENLFTFWGKEFVGSADLIDVPTTILNPFLNLFQIQPTQVLGSTMDLHIEKTTQGPLFFARVSSEWLTMNGTVSSKNGVVTDANISTNTNSNVLQKITNGVFSGTAITNIHVDRLVPVGRSDNEKPECVVQIEMTGDILHTPSKTTISSIKCNLLADIERKTISSDGHLKFGDNESDFNIDLVSTNKNQLDGIDDLWKAITNQLPQGKGNVSITNIPASIFQSFVTHKHINLKRDIGLIRLFEATLNQNTFDFTTTSTGVSANGTVRLQGPSFASFAGTIKANMGKVSAKELLHLSEAADVNISFEELDESGNSAFSGTAIVKKQTAVLQGTTTKNKDGSLSGRIAVSNFPTQFVSPLLADSIGSPLGIEILAKNIMKNPIVTAGGTSEISIFETSLLFKDGTVSTTENFSTVVELEVKQTIPQPLLEDLIIVLFDIQSTERPIRMTLSNASAALDGDLSKLNADIILNIGLATVGPSSLNLGTLSFNGFSESQISAYFDPITITIRNGVATYKPFNVLIDERFPLVYSGSTNFNTRIVKHQYTIPLASLGYSIKELHGLDDDIKVQVLVSGTIDKPMRNVDPSFDLEKLLVGFAVESLGDAIGEQDSNVPNPLDLLEELLDN